MTQHKKAMKDWLSATSRTNLYSPVLSKRIKTPELFYMYESLGSTTNQMLSLETLEKTQKETIREAEAPSVLNR